MKLKILKAELIFQIVVILACSIWFGLQPLKNDSNFVVLYILLFLAISNIVGFLIRIFTYKSDLMAYYFFGVIFYLISLILIGLTDQELDSAFLKIYLVVGSLVISLYYTVSGFFILKEIRLNSKKNILH